MPGIRWRNLLGIYNLAHYDTDKNGVYKHTLKNSVAGDFFLYRTTNIARKHDAWIVSCIFCYQLVTIFSLNCYINFVLVLQPLKIFSQEINLVISLDGLLIIFVLIVVPIYVETIGAFGMELRVVLEYGNMIRSLKLKQVGVETFVLHNYIVKYITLLRSLS